MHWARTSCNGHLCTNPGDTDDDDDDGGDDGDGDGDDDDDDGDGDGGDWGHEQGSWNDKLSLCIRTNYC